MGVGRGDPGVPDGSAGRNAAGGGGRLSRGGRTPLRTRRNPRATATAGSAVTALARVIAVAEWDVPSVRSAVSGLAEVSERLLTWRARLEGLGRELGSPGCWTGP